MNKLKVRYLFYLVISGILFSCAAKEAKNENDESSDSNENKSEALFKNSKTKQAKTKSIRDAEPFYPIDESVEDIQDQINNLKSRVIEYESKINRVTLDPNLLQIISSPNLTHEITLINETIVQGSILQEDVDRIILKTQIGQIRIEKSDIVSIKEIAANSPDLSFESEPDQKIYDDKRVFSGTVINEGMRRADFARVIVHLWDEDTNLIASDSSFVDGSSIQYKSGIVTDCAIESGSTARYETSVFVSDTADVRYITKEIHFNIYE